MAAALALSFIRALVYPNFIIDTSFIFTGVGSSA
jgi:hypothetical protein